MFHKRDDLQIFIEATNTAGILFTPDIIQNSYKTGFVFSLNRMFYLC